MENVNALTMLAATPHIVVEKCPVCNAEPTVIIVINCGQHGDKHLCRKCGHSRFKQRIKEPREL